MTFIQLIEPLNSYFKSTQVPPLTDGEVHYWLNHFKGQTQLELQAVVGSIIQRRQAHSSHTPLPADGSIPPDFRTLTFCWGLGVDF